MGLISDDNTATTGQKIEVRSKTNDPRYYQANELLKQIETLKRERTDLLKKADQFRERIDTLEAQFHKIVLELEPTEVVTVAKPKSQSEVLRKKLENGLAAKLADSPSLLEQLEKILGGLK